MGAVFFWLNGWDGGGGPPALSGTGTISQTSSVTGTGKKAASGAASISQTSSVTGTGVRTIGGPGSISQTSSVTGTGIKAGRGSATLSQSSSITASSGTTARAGGGSIEQPIEETIDHTTDRFGGGMIEQASLITGPPIASAPEPQPTTGGGGHYAGVRRDTGRRAYGRGSIVVASTICGRGVKAYPRLRRQEEELALAGAL